MGEAGTTAVGRPAGRLHIGTSGWHYAHWRGVYYPQDLPPEAWLSYYAREFRSVELNNSFYRLPSRKSVNSWVAATPEGFVFAVKASRTITHLKKLRHCEEPLARFLDVASGLGSRLGPVLFQLPPRWHVNPQRLAEFLELLPDRFRYVFEFRDPSWFCAEIYALLLRHGCAFCQFQWGELVSPEWVTADFSYVRLHGPAGAYAGSYSPQALRDWARKVVDWLGDGKEVFIFFDNDEQAYAVNNARLLNRLCLEMMGGSTRNRPEFS